MSARGGVEPQTETVWRQAEHYGVPRMVYVNKMDILGADFFHVIDMIKDRLKSNAVAIQIPIGKEDSFAGIIDLMTLRAEVYTSEDGMQYEDREVPEDMVEFVNQKREEMVEAIKYYQQLRDEKIPATDNSHALFRNDKGEAVTAAIGALTVKSGKWADDLNTMSKRYSIGTNELQKYAAASELVDVDVETIAKSHIKLEKQSLSKALVGR